MTLTVLPSSDRPLAKPAMWAKCNGCGVCCAADPCRVAREVLDAVDGQPCPVLEFSEGRYWCGFARKLDGFVRQTFDVLMGIGAGCDSNAPEGSLTYKDERGIPRPLYPCVSHLPAPRAAAAHRTAGRGTA